MACYVQARILKLYTATAEDKQVTILEVWHPSVLVDAMQDFWSTKEENSTPIFLFRKSSIWWSLVILRTPFGTCL